MSDPKQRQSKELGFEQLRSQETATRYSFLNRELAREDITTKEGYRSIRHLKYATDPQDLPVRDLAIQRGIVLGHHVPQMSQGVRDAFAIPVSSRPFVYDSSIRSADGLGYTDDMMFYDLGRLLKALASLNGDQGYALQGDIGQHVALVEFTKPDDPKMLLVPGFEGSVVPAHPNEVLLDSYAKQIHGQFEQRFMDSAESFIHGYRAD